MAESNTKLNKAIILILICTVFTSSAQIFLKLGADKLELTFNGLISNFVLIIGLVCYGVAAIILVLALKQGDLSVVYPFLGLSYVWVPILSLIFLGEHLIFLQWVGIAVIILGASFIGRGASSA